MTRPASSTSSPIFIHGAWALAVAVAFAAGYFVSAPPVIDASKTVAAAGGSGSEKIPAVGEGPAASGKSSTPGEAGGAGLTVAQAKERASHCLSERDRLEQMRQICELIPLINKDNWRGVMEAFRVQVAKEFRHPTAEWNFLLEHIGHVAGAEGIEEFLASNLQDRSAQAEMLLTGWVESDGDKAMEWFKSKDKDMQEEMLSAFIRGLSKGDSKRSMELLNEFPKDEAKSYVDGVVANAVQRDGFQASEETFRTLLHQPSGPESFSGDIFRSLALRRMAADRTTGDPFQTLAWFDQYLRPDSPAGPATTSEMMAAAAQKDPAAAAKWLDDRTSRILPELLEPAFRPVAEAYAQSSPDQFLAWMDQHQNTPEHDAMIPAAVQLLHQTGKDDAAAQIIAAVPDPAKRLQLEQNFQKLKSGKARPAGDE